MAASSAKNPKPNFKEIDFQDIEDRELVGRGSFGTVYKAKWKDKYVAVKEFDVLADKKAIETEIKQLSRVEHPNIITLYGVSVTKTAINLIMEYAEGGSLYNLLHGPHQPKYTAAHAMSWARQCAEGVAYMHGMKPKPLIHRDLKPPNLLLFNYGRCLKICDFGTVADKSTQMTNSKGSAAWMAPEVFATSSYTEKCDVFSWGIILWEVLTREVPFAKMQNAHTLSIMWRIHKGDRPDLNRFIGCPQPIEALMKQCWDPEPYKRPAMKQVVELMRSLCSHLPGDDEPVDCNSDTASNNESAYTLETNDDNISTISNNEPFYENLPNPLYDDSVNNTNSDSLNSNENNSNEYPSSIFIDLIGLQIESPNWLATNRIKCDNKKSDDKASSTTSEEQNQSSLNNSVKYVSNKPQTQPLQIQQEIEPSQPDINYLPTNMTDREIKARNESIRNKILKSKTKPLNSLSVEVDPNAWDLSKENMSHFYSDLSKNDGKERLTITETKAVHNRDDDSTIRTSSLISHQQHHNINTQCGSGVSATNSSGVRVSIVDNQTSDGYDDDSNIDDADESYHLILDSELQPETPDPNNKLSQKIFKEHKKLAKEYLQVDEELYYANAEKQKLLDSMEPEERNRKLQFIKKVAEKKELAELKQYLQQQLEELRELQRMQEIEQQQNHQQFLLQQHQQQLQQHQYQRQPSIDSTDENGWVVVPGDRGGQPKDQL
ncbi:mitogen-activated protein kinase kinase kinase 7 [Condylostylus longicornis]|uniref:mitogen-activated protein kinase kinase kinase 7 n=1 Tax=Condylostylus longicornis TaxID=2530218 RepID=UPI00244E535E|nr:mitogen-activated protein kinase kinase kinase 7 [Condylostylus longicornis]